MWYDVATMTDAEPVTRGRPRSERARRAILAAASRLLLDVGVEEMSMDTLAAHAGVSKATIYRWWTSKELVALDALLELWIEASVEPGGPDTGALREDLFQRVKVWAALPQAELGRALGGLVAKARRDTDFSIVYLERFVHPRREAARPLFVRAIDRGEIPAETDIETAIDLLYGPIYHRVLHGHQLVDIPFIRMVVDSLVDALHARVERLNA